MQSGSFVMSAERQLVSSLENTSICCSGKSLIAYDYIAHSFTNEGVQQQYDGPISLVQKKDSIEVRCGTALYVARFSEARNHQR